MDQEETIDERYCFDDEDILSIADSLGFTIPDESIEPMKRKFNSLWKDKTKETNKKLLEKQCKEDNGLSLKTFLFCEEYLKTGNIQKTCSNLGIGRTTGFNYLKEKEVDEYLKKRRETIRKETEEMISSNYQKAMEGLSQMMEDTGNDETRIKAIDIFLKYHNKSSKEGSKEGSESE